MYSPVAPLPLVLLLPADAPNDDDESDDAESESDDAEPADGAVEASARGALALGAVANGAAAERSLVTLEAAERVAAVAFDARNCEYAAIAASRLARAEPVEDEDGRLLAASRACSAATRASAAARALSSPEASVGGGGAMLACLLVHASSGIPPF